MLRPDTLALTALLALLSALGPVSTDMYLSSLPDIGRKLAAAPAEVQLTLSVFLVGFAIGQIVYGPLSDRYGRKPVLMIALLVYGAGCLACAFAPSIETLLAARAAQAFGGSGGVVLARAIVRDLYAGARAGRELSLMGAIMALAPVVAPPVGGVLQTLFGWRASFLVALVVGLSAFVLVWRWLPETIRERAPEPISLIGTLRTYRSMARNRAFLAHLGIVAVSYAGIFVWISGSPFVLQDLYGLSAFAFGLAFASACVGFLAGSFLATRLVTRIGLDRTIGLGAVALATGGLAMLAAVAFHAASAVFLVLPTAIYLCGIGLAMPQAMAGALTPFPNRAGAASSLVGFVQQTSAAVLGALVGHMLGTSAWPIAAPFALMGCATLVLWVISRNVRRRDAAHPPPR